MRGIGLLGLVLAASAGCATLAHGSRQTVTVTSDPSGATVTVLSGQTVKSAPGVTPITLELARRDPNITLRLAKPGCAPVDVRLRLLTPIRTTRPMPVKPTFPMWLLRIGDILHLLDRSCSNVRIASVAPRGWRRLEPFLSSDSVLADQVRLQRVADTVGLKAVAHARLLRDDVAVGPFLVQDRTCTKSRAWRPPS